MKLSKFFLLFFLISGFAFSDNFTPKRGQFNQDAYNSSKARKSRISAALNLRNYLVSQYGASMGFSLSDSANSVAPQIYSVTTESNEIIEFYNHLIDWDMKHRNSDMLSKHISNLLTLAKLGYYEYPEVEDD